MFIFRPFLATRPVSAPQQPVDSRPLPSPALPVTLIDVVENTSSLVDKEQLTQQPEITQEENPDVPISEDNLFEPRPVLSSRLLETVIEALESQCETSVDASFSR